MRWIARSLVIFCLLLTFLINVYAEITFSDSPDWNKNSSSIPTGCGWADFDGNGWMDLVVSQGLDAASAPDHVYFNTDGEISTTPGWISSESMRSGHVYIGDLDNDNDPDLVVATLGRIGYQYPHHMYFNDNGLSILPGWSSPDANAFSCVLGDPNNDGYLDVAFGNGFRAIDPTQSSPQNSKIFLNNGGSFSTHCDWQSDSLYLAVDITFVDIEMDGDHDLVVSGRDLGIKLFENVDGQIATSPTWETDAIIGGRQISFGDFDNDGDPDLAAAGMGQGFYIFRNNDGVLEDEPCWSMTQYNEPSAVYWVDADGDGDLDLAGGAWSGDYGVVENLFGGIMDNQFTWAGNTSAYVEQISFCDYDEDGLIETQQQFICDGSRKLFYLDKHFLHEISSIDIDGTTLEYSAYCYDLVEGWISLADQPAENSVISVNYTYSEDLDLVVTTSSRTRIHNNRQVVPPPEHSILFLMDNNYGANYGVNQNDPSISIRAHFEQYNWNITVASLSATVTPCQYGNYFGCSEFPVDINVADIEDITQYDAISIMPGTSYDALLASEEVQNLLVQADEAGMIISAWCRGVRILAAADVIDGHEVSGHADYEAEYTAAGATLIPNDPPPVVSGNIVTTTRSRFYRTQMSEAIRDAVLNQSSAPETGSIQPRKYKLNQNYPNPFNDSTTISFELATPQEVTLKIYNTLGEEVASLINQRLNSGHHEISYTTGDLASGVYFYRLECEQFSGVRKMVYMR